MTMTRVVEIRAQTRAAFAFDAERVRFVDEQNVVRPELFEQRGDVGTIAVHAEQRLRDDEFRAPVARERGQREVRIHNFFHAREADAVDQARVILCVRIDDVDVRRERGDRTGRREIARAEEQRVLAPHVRGEFHFERAMRGSRAAKETGTGRTGGRLLRERGDHARVARETEIIVRREIVRRGRCRCTENAAAVFAFELFEPAREASEVQLRHLVERAR